MITSKKMNKIIYQVIKTLSIKFFLGEEAQ